MNTARSRPGARVALALVALVLAVAATAVVHHRQAQALPKDDIRRMSVAVGEAFLVRLPANPSTGYGWAVDSDPARLELISRHHVSGPSGLAGSPGTDEFTMRGLATGEYELRFSYERAWEGRVEQSVVYRITAY